VRSGIGFEEKILVVCELFNPLKQLGLVEESLVGSGLEVLAVPVEEELLEVGVVEDVWVHGPSSISGLVLFVGKSNSV
jgi:hypothetical protein